MKKQCKPHLTIVPRCVRLLACCLLAGGAILNVQKSHGAITTPTPENSNAVFFATSGGMAGAGVVISADGSNGVVTAGVAINGKDIVSVLLETFDVNHDGKVTLAELKQVADAYFTLWDTNAVGNLTQAQLSNEFKQFFPNIGTPVGMCVVNGVAVQVPADQMPTPYGELAKHILAAADTNKDGQLSLLELNNFLDKSFSQWDQDGDGSLDAQELAAAFGQLSMPDLPPPQQ